MNVYDRLLNILAESLTPEYWQRHELIHYLKLAQSAFAYDTKLLAKHKKLIPKLKNKLSSFKRTNIPSAEIESGIYEFPEDCRDVISMMWDNKQVGHKNITYINTYAGGRNSETQGVGRSFYQGWDEQIGKPLHWLNEENGIRFFPKEPEEIFQMVLSLSDEEIEDVDNYSATIPEQINENSGFYYSVYGLGIWRKMEIGEDFILVEEDDTVNFIPINRIFETIKNYKKDFNYNISFMFMQESQKASMYYAYEPQFIDLKPITGEEGVQLELNGIHDEYIACYAAYLALSKEGDKTQDLEKAAIYLKRYQEGVSRCRLGRSEIDVDPCNNLPFMI